MTTKYQRPNGPYQGQNSLGNRDKYQQDAAAQPKVAISSQKMDGDFNYIIDALNQIDEASGTATSIAQRLEKSLNGDGTLKASATAVVDDWVRYEVTGLNRVDGSTVSFNGGDVSLFSPNRRVRLQVDGKVLFGHVAEVEKTGNVTSVSLVDITDDAGQIQTIDQTPSELAYSPLITGSAGNLNHRFDALKTADLAVEGEGALLKLTDVGGAGKTFALRVQGQNFEILENTGTDTAPIWQSRMVVDSNGMALASNSVDGSHIQDGVVTPQHLADTGVVAGSYNLPSIDVNDKGQVTSVSAGVMPQATTTVAGLVEVASASDVKNETDTGETGASLVATPNNLKQHQGMAKAWVNFNGASAVYLRGSHNVSSVTDLGVGSYQVNLTSPMIDSNYCVTAGCNGRSAVAGYVPSVEQLTASNFQLHTGRPISGSNLNYNMADCDHVFATVYGEI